MSGLSREISQRTIFEDCKEGSRFPVDFRQRLSHDTLAYETCHVELAITTLITLMVLVTL